MSEATIQNDDVTPIQAILDLLDSAISMRKRMQDTSPQSEKEITKMKEVMAALEANDASLKATEPFVAIPMPATPTPASSEAKNAGKEWISSIE